jgi:uncharacterized protein (TIGR02677 family)
MWTKPVPELKYVNAENVARYRLIMRFFYQQYKRLRYWLKPEEIYQGVCDYGLLEDYTLEQCQQDLETLTEWKNLTHRHDGGRSATVEEYFRKKFRYLLTPYSIEIERMLESLEQVQGYGGSLEPSLFDKIANQLKDIVEKTGTFPEEEALQYWRELLQSFTQLHENASDYLASLQTGQAEELMMTESFLVFKDTLTHYLQNFIQSLQKSSYKIEGYLRQMNGEKQEMFLHQVFEDENRLPNLEETRTEEERKEQLEAEWSSFRRWFLGDANDFSDLYYLEQATKDTIARVVRSVLRIQEKRQLGVSRKRELDYLGNWFFRLDTLEDAKKLAAYSFGLYQTRHFQGFDEQSDDSGKSGMWQEAPMIQRLRSRSRKRIHEQGAEPVRQSKQKQQASRKDYLARRKKEDEMIQALVARRQVKLSSFDEISADLRNLLLYWVGRCLTQPSHKIRTADGVEIKMIIPDESERTILEAEDGALELPDYQFTFEMTGMGVDDAREQVAAALEGTGG